MGFVMVVVVVEEAGETNTCRTVVSLSPSSGNRQPRALGRANV